MSTDKITELEKEVIDLRAELMAQSTIIYAILGYLSQTSGPDFNEHMHNAIGSGIPESSLTNLSPEVLERIERLDKKLKEFFPR
ncbi:hypothetical protein [Enterobacter sp.]|uniref:hypothetical protein n=1 Tax=Enterobacter sp. TaxID=42895 RepID=UPI002982652B|nr:hypothetical protein [Enterobacter sp.]